jgi:trigger factor
MDVSVEKLPKSLVKLTVELDVDEVQPYLDAAAHDLSKEHPVKGFRPGSVPFEAMRSVVGDQTLAEKALQQIVPKTYVQTLMEREDIEAIGRPEVMARNVALGQPWKYEATVAVLPEVHLGGYQNIRGEKRELVVESQDVERELETLQKMRASYLTVPRPAQKGDRADVDIQATVENVPLEQGSATNQPILLGDGHLVPGFEEQILGMCGCETKTFTIAFPQHHHQPNLRGRTVQFTVTVNVVQQRILPTVDDTFAQGVGKFSGLQDLREKLTANIRVEKEEKEHQRLQVDLLNQVVKTTTFGEFPDILVEGEVDKMLSELQEGLGATGLSLDEYLQQIHKTADEVRAGFRPQALDRIRAGLTLRAIAKAEHVEVSDEEVTEEIQKVLQQFPDVEEAKKRVDLEELTGMATGTIRNRKAFALLEKFAGVG